MSQQPPPTPNHIFSRECTGSMKSMPSADWMKTTEFKYHDPLEGYPDLVEKTQIPNEIVMAGVANRPKVHTNIFKMCIFRGGSNANEFY